MRISTTPVNALVRAGLRADLAGLTARDAERIATALESDIAPSTRAAYASSWHRWEAWCDGRGVGPFPAAPELIAAFLAERAEEGLTFGTLDAMCSAIAHRHTQEGLPDPTTDLRVRRVRRGLRRILGTAPIRQAHPLTVAEVGQVVGSLYLGSGAGVRDRALILLGYAAALRPSELAALGIDDLAHRASGVLVTIRRSKTDQDGLGQVVGVVAGEHRRTDPIAALAAWLGTRPVGPGPLLTRIKAGAPTLEPIGVRTVSRLVHDRAVEAALDASRVTGHSLRAGHATTAAANGATVARIAAQTRHRDIGTLVEHYVRPSDALAVSTSRDLGL